MTYVKIPLNTKLNYQLLNCLPFTPWLWVSSSINQYVSLRSRSTVNWKQKAECGQGVVGLGSFIRTAAPKAGGEG